LSVALGIVKNGPGFFFYDVLLADAIANMTSLNVLAGKYPFENLVAA